MRKKRADGVTAKRRGRARSRKADARAHAGGADITAMSAGRRRQFRAKESRTPEPGEAGALAARYAFAFRGHLPAVRVLTLNGGSVVEKRLSAAEEARLAADCFLRALPVGEQPDYGRVVRFVGGFADAATRWHGESQEVLSRAAGSLEGLHRAVNAPITMAQAWARLRYGSLGSLRAKVHYLIRQEKKHRSGEPWLVEWEALLLAAIVRDPRNPDERILGFDPTIFPAVEVAKACWDSQSDKNTRAARAAEATAYAEKLRAFGQQRGRPSDS